ncbi:hypothetical protein JTY60_02115 [symbiont of Argiope bruennichi]|uniref:hypothetical protein n=1 Tax=symbiont of Argiope bruennichi TaxID=2810479 RepID=UPI003DA58C9F
MSRFRVLLQKFYLFCIKEKLLLFLLFIFFSFSLLFSGFLSYFVNIYNYQNTLIDNSKKRILYLENAKQGEFFQKKLVDYKDKIDDFNNYLNNNFFANKTISIDEFINKLDSDDFKKYSQDFFGFLIDSLFFVPNDLKTIFLNFSLELTNYYINQLKKFANGKDAIRVTLTSEKDLFEDIEANLNSLTLFYDSKISDIFDNSYEITNSVNLPIPSNLYFYFDPQENLDWFPFNPFIIKRGTILPIFKSKIVINFCYCYNLLNKQTSNEKIFFLFLF